MSLVLSWCRLQWEWLHLFSLGSPRSSCRGPCDLIGRLVIQMALGDLTTFLGNSLHTSSSVTEVMLLSWKSLVSPPVLSCGDSGCPLISSVHWTVLFLKLWLFAFLLQNSMLLFTCLFIAFYWNIIDSQCCVNLSCIAKWFSFLDIYILFHILFRYGLSKGTDYSPLYYTVGACCLSILYVIVCIC